jgi:deoxycytidine triphosphate deaminase
MNQNPSNITNGILVKQDIEAAINRGQLIKNAVNDNLQACSYDMRIGTVFKDGQIINTSSSQSNTQFVVKPGEIISIFTWEDIELPDDVMATAFAINSQSSRGLLVLNPGHIDPGFKGCLTVKAFNMRKAPLTITRGMPIFTVVFQQLPKSTTSPYDKNIPRDQREREFNEKDVEVSARNLSEIVTIEKDSPYPTRQDVKELIQNHWMSWWSLILSFIAAVAGIIAVALVLIPKNQVDNNLTSPKPTPTQTTR